MFDLDKPIIDLPPGAYLEWARHDVTKAVVLAVAAVLVGTIITYQVMTAGARVLQLPLAE